MFVFFKTHTFKLQTKTVIL